MIDNPIEELEAVEASNKKEAGENLEGVFLNSFYLDSLLNIEHALRSLQKLLEPEFHYKPRQLRRHHTL